MTECLIHSRAGDDTYLRPTVPPSLSGSQTHLLLYITDSLVAYSNLFIYFVMYLGFLCAYRRWLSCGLVGSVALSLHIQLIINTNISIQLLFTVHHIHKGYGYEFGYTSYCQRKMYGNIYEVMRFARDMNTLWKHDINFSMDWLRTREFNHEYK